MAKRKNYYAVRIGRNTGIYQTWEECEANVKGYSGALYQGFQTRQEAETWLKSKMTEKQRHNEDEKKHLEKMIGVQLNDEQCKALEQMESGKNIFLSGGAGTGKSFLMRYFISQMQDKNIIVCAPTGIAALQVGGVTIHRMFGLKPEPIEPGKNLPKIREEIKEADIIIIDEISMCRFDVFDYVCRYIQKAQENSERKKQLIVVGDFFQLPPVIKQEEWNTLRKLWGENLQKTEGFAFETQMWKEMNFQTIILKEVIRQKGDHLFVEHLNKIRLGDCSAIEWFNQHTAVEEQKGVYLCNKNGLAKTINKQKILELNEQVVKYRGKIEGKVSDCPTEENLELCVGARVMSVVNDNGGHYQNGSLGTVEKLSETSVIVQFDNGYKKELKDYTWEYFDYHVLQDVKTGKMLLEKTVIGTFKQIPLKIAFAITVHKSQGQTYDSANFIPDCFAKGQLYVALSRVACSDALYLEQKINKKDLIVSEKVKEFYRMNGTSL